MEDIKCSQPEVIEEFMVAITETEEYKSVEYLVFSIRKQMLNYFTSFRGKDNVFRIPPFLQSLVERVGKTFQEMQISVDDVLNYMEQNDSNGWVMYYDRVFIRRPGVTETIQINAELLFLIITGFVLDTFKNQRININEMLNGEKFIYKTNSYGLTLVNGVEFKTDSFIFDSKAYLYNILTNISQINFGDRMPGFAKIITEEVDSGDILLRLDERLAVPQEQIISYSTLDFQKFRGPQFHFANSDLTRRKTIIVHIAPETSDKLLMVIKKDYDDVKNKDFLHIEIETLPFCPAGETNASCITTFLHGMYYPADDIFTHIDYTRNQYTFSDYEQKYMDANPDIPVDFYAEKKLHYKIWCIENGEYTREVWYKLMIASLHEKYRILLDEILS